MIELDNGVPIPPSQFATGGHARKYPWDQMQIGDSFFVPSVESEGLGTAANRISVASRRYGDRHGIRFTTRSVVEGGVKGVRVWRIADEPKLRVVK